MTRLLTLGLALITITHAAAQDSSVSVGSTTLVVPPPEGYVRIDGQGGDEWNDHEKSITAASNRILAYYGSPADLEEVKAGEFPTLENSFNIQTLIKAEGLKLTPKDFANLVRSVEQEMDSVSQEMQEGLNAAVDNAGKQLSKATNQNVDLEIGETQMLGVHDQGPHHVSFSMINQVSIQVDGEQVDEPAYTAASVVNVANKLIYLYADGDPGEENQARINASLADWRTAIQAANPTPLSNSFGSLFQNKIIRGALVGGLLGGIIGLFGALLRKGRAKAA